MFDATAPRPQLDPQVLPSPAWIGRVLEPARALLEQLAAWGRPFPRGAAPVPASACNTERSAPGPADTRGMHRREGPPESAPASPRLGLGSVLDDVWPDTQPAAHALPEDDSPALDAAA